MSVKILGLDPGFANLGTLGMKFTAAGSARIVRTEVLVTCPMSKKLRRREMDDELRRLTELRCGLSRIIDEFEPDAIASEQRPQLRSQKASAQVALAYAMTFTLACERGLPFLVYTIGEIKQEVCGDRQAPKSKIIERLRHLDPRFKAWPDDDGIKHCADAGGAAMCGAKDSVMQAIMRERGRK